jgi:deoxyribodipyrimidine photo-lyase
VTLSATLVWFRQDLRLQDNPALVAALARGGPVVPVFILDDSADGAWVPGGASRWWLHHSLTALGAALQDRGSRLILRRGEVGEVLRELVRATGAGAVYWNRCYEPAAIARDKALKAALTAEGLEVKSFNAALLNEPHTIENKQGRPFQVFTPYWRHCLTLPVEAPQACTTRKFPAPRTWPASAELAEWQLRPRIPWDQGMAEMWTPGEAGAARRLKAFAGEVMARYADQRNFPGLTGTSMLSPHLHFGEISPRQIWAAVQAVSGDSGIFPPSKGAAVFLSEVGWREFAYHLLFHFPHTPESPLREDFNRFPWAEDPAGEKLRAWQRGRTGYPIVDAGMRELWHTGWMHNRVRMIVGSFLVKHLRLPWQAGARWFWDTLVDADLAANTLGWQWTAGCGADAAPYFRVFAPVLQGQKFDADGAYVRRWVPELAGLPAEYLHCPWEAPSSVLAAAKVTLGKNYPRPIVDHAEARAAALAAFKSIRGEDVVER